MPAFYGRGSNFEPPQNSNSLFGLGDDAFFPDDLPDPTGDTTGDLDTGIDGVVTTSPTGSLDPNDLGDTGANDPAWGDVFAQMTALAPRLTLAMQSMQSASGPAAQQNKTAQWNDANDKLISAVAQFNAAADVLNTFSTPGGMFATIPSAGLAGGLPSIIGGLSVGGFLLIISVCIAAISACSSLVSSVLGKENPISKALADAVAAVNGGVTKALVYGMIAVGIFMLLGAEKR